MVSTRFLLFMIMKKLLAILTVIVGMLTYSIAAQSTNNPNVMKVRWDAPNDTNVVGYSLYYKTLAATNFSTTNIVGLANTNAALPVVVNTVYEIYVTAKDAGGLESDPSNKIRGQNILVNGFGKLTPITLLDASNTNFIGFVFSSGASNGVVTGTAPNLTYTATNTVGKDMLVFKSPESFLGIPVTNYYGIYRAMNNSPTISLP